MMDQADMYAMQQADAHHDEETQEEILARYENTETPSSTPPTDTQTTPPATNTTPQQTTALTTEEQVEMAKKDAEKKNNSGGGESSSGNGVTSTEKNNNSCSDTTNNNTTVVGGRTTTRNNTPSGKMMVDPHDPSRILANLDDPNSLRAAAELMADANLGYKVTAYGENSSIVKNFRSYSEIYEYLSNFVKNNSLQAKEPAVKQYVMNVAINSDNYSMEAYQRKALSPGKKTDLKTHSLYVITDKSNNEKVTLSFNGTSKFLFSTGAWGLNTETDAESYNSYKNGDNIYDMSLLISSEKIDVRQTSVNIVDSINSSASYFAIDHKYDFPNMENCNTALYTTIAVNSKKVF